MPLMRACLAGRLPWSLVRAQRVGAVDEQAECGAEVFACSGGLVVFAGEGAVLVAFQGLQVDGVGEVRGERGVLGPGDRDVSVAVGDSDRNIPHGVREYECGTVLDDDHLHTVVGERPQGTVHGLSACCMWAKVVHGMASSLSTAGAETIFCRRAPAVAWLGPR